MAHLGLSKVIFIAEPMPSLVFHHEQAADF
jgi:hypothetical protein